VRPPPPELPASRRPFCSAITCTESRTSGRTSAASLPSARATSTTSYSPPRLAMTCVMRGSSARHFFSSFSSSATFFAESSDATGSMSRYSGTGSFLTLLLTRLACPLPAMARVAFAASCSASKLISSE